MAAKTWVDTPTSGTPITAADLNRIENAIAWAQSQILSMQERNGRLLWSGSQSSSSSDPIELDLPDDASFDYSQILVCISGLAIPCAVSPNGRVNGTATNIVSGSDIIFYSFWGNLIKSGTGGHFSATLNPDSAYMQFAGLYTSMDDPSNGFGRTTYTISSIIGVA